MSVVTAPRTLPRFGVRPSWPLRSLALWGISIGALERGLRLKSQQSSQVLFFSIVHIQLENTFRPE